MSEQPENTPALTQEEKRALLARLLKEKAREQVHQAPLSDGQRAMWYIQQSAPDNTAYNVSLSMRIRSPLDVDQLQKIIQAVVNRHATLRTTYLHLEDQPVQQIHLYQDADFVHIDASLYNEEELYQQVLNATKQPFQLDTGPVARWRLFTVSQQNHVFSATFHHIAVDATSIALILEDLRKGLLAVSEDKPVILDPEPEPYTRWAEWQQQMLASAAGQVQRNYWVQKLAGDLPIINLPYDFAHPTIQTYNGRSFAFSIPAQTTQQLRSAAQAAGVTLFTLLVAVYQLLLHRYTSQPDILVGTPTAGRGHPEFKTTVGYFDIPVVLRSTLDDITHFRAFLNQVKTTVLDALIHQDFPFIRIVENLRLHQDPSRSPVFQCSFDMINAQHVNQIANLLNPVGKNITVEFGGLLVEPYFIPQQEGGFELTLNVVDAGEVIFCTLHYHTDLFKPATADRIAASYQLLLNQILDNPDIALADLQILSPQDHLLLEEWNQTQFNYPAGVCLHQLFETQVERNPSAIAVIYEDQSITYAALNARANQLARFLRTRGVAPGKLVGICMERSIEVIIAFLGVLKAGAAYVPIDPGYPPDRLALMITDSQIQILLTQQSLQDILPEVDAELICLDTGWAAVAAESEANPAVPLSTEDLAYVIYTSGSTGKPKGVMIPHRAIVSHITWANDFVRVTDKDIVVQKFPFSFDPSVWEIFAPLAAGAKLVMAQPGGHQDGNYLVQLIQEQGITLLLLVPSLLQLLVETPDFENCTSLRIVGVGGEALTMALVRSYAEVQKAPLCNLYGPTETTIATLYWLCDPHHPQSTAPIGRPLGNTRLYILDKNLQPTPIGVPGELHIGGTQVGTGYFNRPELTAERFIPDPFSADPPGLLYKTGDLVRYRPDGIVEFLGRNDSQVKIRGFRIELGEIEAVLNQHPAVTHAVVTVREDTPGDKRLVAYYTTAVTPPARELTRFLRDKLPSYMVPSAFVTVESFPLSPSGKVDPKQLPAPTQSAVETRKTVQPPATPMELVVADAWRAALKLEQINTFDNFFDLGGHSLLGMRVVNEIKEKTGIRIEPAYLRFESLGQLAARLDEKTSGT